MNNENDPMNTEQAANDQPKEPRDAPQTPEQVMQAAAGAHRRTRGGAVGDEGPLDARRGRNGQRPRPRPSRGQRNAAVRRSEVRPGRGGGGRQPAPWPDSLPAPAAGEPEIVTRLREGLESIERNFLAILERNGIKREDPTGTPFDPNLHQAMAEQESAAHPPGSVMHAWTPAWTLNGRLLRPAMVVVAKAPPGEITGASGAALDTTA